ncbi:MAG: DUF4389 domain-containing protein [Caldiserica bacterium]|nr:DUF4389 domain-containing protein [Caldisericota bacterium]MDH7562701.1 DUF4389 domain-containing protein [Caldisericota bacterium]
MSEFNVKEETGNSFPATLEVDYPDRKLNWLTSFFRLFTVIPIAIILGLLANGTIRWGTPSEGWSIVITTGGMIFLPLVLMILFRQKYPKWWFDWNLNFSRFSYRVMSYLLLLRDEYPSTDEEQAVHLNLVYPDAKKELNRYLPLIKWLLALPHWILLAFLSFFGIFVWLLAWFSIIFTGRYPKGLFDYMVGLLRWSFRVQAYAFLLITDKYPPFSMAA